MILYVGLGPLVINTYHLWVLLSYEVLGRPILYQFKATLSNRDPNASLARSASTLAYRRHFLFLRSTACLRLSPRPSLSRPYPLVQTYTYCVLGIDLTIEGSLEIPMSSETFLDEATPPSLRPQLQSLEPLYVFFVEEHVPNSDKLLVNLVRVPSQYDTLGNDTRSGGRERSARCYQAKRCARYGNRWLEEKRRNRTPGDRCDEGCDGGLARVEVAQELVNIVGGITRLRVHWIDEKPTRAALQDQLVFRSQRARMVRAQCDAVVDHCSFLLVLQKRVESQRPCRIVCLLENEGRVAQMYVNPSARLYTAH